jgi:hypothetical protein
LSLQHACQREKEPTTFEEKHRRLWLLSGKYFQTTMAREIKDSGLRVARWTRSCLNATSAYLCPKALAADKTFVML